MHLTFGEDGADVTGRVITDAAPLDWVGSLLQWGGGFAVLKDVLGWAAMYRSPGSLHRQLEPQHTHPLQALLTSIPKQYQTSDRDGSPHC